MIVYYKTHYILDVVKTTFNEFCKMLNLSKKERRKLKSQLKKGPVTIYLPIRKPIVVSKNDMSITANLDPEREYRKVQAMKKIAEEGF